jgi:hypothetical protein
MHEEISRNLRDWGFGLNIRPRRIRKARKMNLVWLGVKNNVTRVNLRYALQLMRMMTHLT